MPSHVFFDSEAGLCPGVKRTIMDALEVSGKEKSVVSYGELIHNPSVVSQLRENGITVVHQLSEICMGQFVIIRAHGIPPSDEAYLSKNNIRYMDLTCPRVKSVHKIISGYKDRDYMILIAGHAAHPETIGHIGYAGGNGVVVSTIEEAREIELSPRCVLIAQTTISLNLFNNMYDILVSKQASIERVNTICSFTIQRQKWIETFSKKVGFSIIIGGKKSSNTRLLYDIALANGSAIWIEESSELNSLNLSMYDTFAITGGTSTPKDVFDQAALFFRKQGATIEYVEESERATPTRFRIG